LTVEALSNVGLAERISPRKSEEISLLQTGAGNTTQSTLGVRIGRIRARRDAGDTFQGKILDLVVFEASRLMKQFPKLNSTFSENQIFHYSSINAGVAFDSGSKLVVYGIENSNAKTLREIREEIEDSLDRYLSDRLSLREMTRATFTVTDLSASQMDFVLPILPARQSCIIGVTRNSKEEFSIYVGFDHRVTLVLILGAAVLLLYAAAILAFAPRRISDARRAMAALPLIALAVVPSTLVHPTAPSLQGLLLFVLVAFFVWGERLRFDGGRTTVTLR